MENIQNELDLLRNSEIEQAEVIERLKKKGFSAVQATIILAKHYGLPLNAAMELLHGSELWRSEIEAGIDATKLFLDPEGL